MKLSTRNILAYLVAQSLISLGFVHRSRKKALRGEHILSIYFHNPTNEEFEFVIHWLIKNGFSFINMDELKNIIKETKVIPKGAVLITVDDGCASNISNLADVAIRKEIPITIFIPTEAIEEGNYWFRYAKQAEKEGMKYPTSNELKKLPNKERMAIISEIKKRLNLPREAMTVTDVQSLNQSKWISFGGHSHSHPILPNCNEEELISELSLSKRKIEEWLGCKIDTFAYPNGDYGPREITALKEEGYLLGFSNKPFYLSPSNLESEYEIPRIGFLEGASKAENICRIVGVWHHYTLKIFKK